MSKKRIRKITLVLLALIAFGVTFRYYQRHISATRIAFINYSSFHLARIQKANTSKWISIESLSEDKLDASLDHFDALFIFGRGLKLNEQQLEAIRRAGNRGLPIFAELPNPDQEVTNLQGKKREEVNAYLRNGGGKNYRNLLLYARTVLDGKTWFAPKPAAPTFISKDVLFHLDDDRTFETAATYEQYLKAQGIYREGGARIALLTSVPGPFNANRDHLDAMIEAFQAKGWNVYPIASTTKRLAFLKAIKPDVVVEMPHGRISAGDADQAVAWLKTRNVPILSPLSIFDSYEHWQADPQGISGGLLTMSVVLPEIDGAVAPYALTAQFQDKSGYAIYQVIPGRLEKFCGLVEHWIDLKRKANKDKKIAIYYFKGPGMNSLIASNLEVVPSLYRTLQALKKAGYTVNNLPADVKGLEKLLRLNGAVLKPYAEGTLDRFFREGNPALVPVDTFRHWAEKDLTAKMREAVIEKYGEAPGTYMATQRKGKDYLGVARINFGNVVLLPQPLPGIGDNTFELVHGAKVAPPYPYIASYLWARHSFQADAILHFGTHGSLEFTPGKQVALSDDDWSNALIGNTPHFYLYTMSNVGEAIIAKRRSYATIISHLTAPFMQSGTYQGLSRLEEELHRWEELDNPSLKAAYGKTISARAKTLGFYHDIGVDTNRTLHAHELKKLSNLVEEVADEKVAQGLYTIGKAYTEKERDQTLMQLCIDPIAYGLAKMDIAKGLVNADILDNKYVFNKTYRAKAERLLLARLASADTSLSGVINETDAKRASRWLAVMHKQPKSETKRPVYVDEVNGKEKAFAEAFLAVRTALRNIYRYREALHQSTSLELEALLNAFNGGYTAPSVGGDPIASPAALPTGRNLFCIDAEKTPSAQGWALGVQLAQKVIAEYQAKHEKQYPKKVALTLWAGDFIQTDGAMMAEALYLLGVEPVRDALGKVVDIRLIPAAQLKRPRIDVVIQTSGQFRDLAASRIALLNEAVSLAAQAEDSSGAPNFVKEGAKQSERMLKEKGFSPKEAKELATLRVFGGIDGQYGSAIMGMVEKGDAYKHSDEVANTYIHNMGAVYNDDKTWAYFKEGLFETALQHTDVVLQPRQSNTWGPISLDHVYEFAGGMNNAVRKVTGKEPDVFFSDFRNSLHARVQNMKEAIWVEARSTLLNPKYVQAMMQGSSSSAETFAETFRNTFGWSVMKSDAIDNALWNELEQVYVEDRLGLHTQAFFEQQNPFALEEMTGVLLEAHRKGLWKASEAQLKATALLHSRLAGQYGAGCSAFVCGNTALRDEVNKHLDDTQQKAYSQALDGALNAGSGEKDQLVLRKENPAKAEANVQRQESKRSHLIWYCLGGLFGLGILTWFVRQRRKNRS